MPFHAVIKHCMYPNRAEIALGGILTMVQGMNSGRNKKETFKSSLLEAIGYGM